MGTRMHEHTHTHTHTHTRTHTHTHTTHPHTYTHNTLNLETACPKDNSRILKDLDWVPTSLPSKRSSTGACKFHSWCCRRWWLTVTKILMLAQVTVSPKHSATYIRTHTHTHTRIYTYSLDYVQINLTTYKLVAPALYL